MIRLAEGSTQSKLAQAPSPSTHNQDIREGINMFLDKYFGRIMLLMGVVAVPLIVYDVHEMKLVLYALTGF